MNGNEPAMPSTPLLHRVDTPTGLKEVSMFGHLGLTKRELFAAMAMQGMLANESNDWDGDFYAKGAVLLADALIKQLAEPPK